MPRDEEETATAKPKPKYAANPFANTRGPNVSANRPRPTTQPRTQQQNYERSEGQTQVIQPQREQSIEEKLGQQPRRETPYKYYTDQATGLTRKVKLPGALSGTYRAPSATMEKVKQGQANWTDVFTAERERILKDPNFYKTNQITQYAPFIQQQIIADKAFDWTQVPPWQRPFYEASSRPVVAGAVQGLVMGLGNPGGAVVGAAIGAAAQATGYDQTKEAWQQGDNKFTWDVNQLKEAGKGAFGYLNLLAEWGEKVIGTSAMAVNAAADPNKEVKDVLNKDTFNANASFFEVIAPAIKAAEQGDGRITWSDAQKLIPALWQGGVIADLVLHPEKYKGEEYYLGAAMPVELQQTWTERIDAARAEIAKGRDYREVMTEMQTGIMAQIGDMAGQGVFDPLNVMPKVETGIIRKGAELAGNKPLAEAFTGVETPREGVQKFRTLVQTGEAAKIDPNFDAAKLNGFEKAIAGLNKSGEVKAGGLTNKGLLDPADPKKPAGGLFEETPQSRAQTGATMFDRNIGTLMTMFKDPMEAVGYIRRIAGGDMTAWKELGSSIGNSPEWYTILPALKDFSTSKLEGLAKAWEVTAINRDALGRVAEVLGDNPTKLIDDWASRNNTDQDFARIIQRAKEANTPESNALLKEFEAGTFTPDTLKQIVDLFHGEGALPHTEAQWKWAMYADMSDHFAEWVAKHLLLDKSPEATNSFFQTMAVLKQAQSIILLGASPGYAIQNGLSGIVHLATDGIYGSMTPRQMDDWITRWETPIPRLDEGVGIGGMVDTARSSAISDAVKGSGPLTDLKRTLSRIQRGMPMSKLSSNFESVNSKRGYVAGIKKFWANSWRRGVGFRKMEPALAKVLTDAGINPNRIYAAIEAGANQKEIERALTGQYKGMQAKALINDAAQSAGITPAQAAEMLDKIGLTETLDAFLAGADTPDKVDAAFARANKKMQDWIDLKYGERLATRAEEVKNIVGREGMAAGLNVAQQASNQFYDAWFDHYARFGDVMGGLEGLEPAQRSKVIEEAYRQSDANFRRVFASMGANYQGIFDVWGLSGDPDATSAVHAISDMNNSMKEAYDFMRQKRNELSATLIREDRAPTSAELSAVSKSVDAAFDKAFKAKHAAEVRMGDALKGVYTKLHGETAGAAAKLWWNDVMKFSEKIVADEKKFRAEQDTARQMGADRASISDAKKKYYSENKQRWIADLQKINDEGIARLERIIKSKGGDATPTPAPTTPPPPSDTGPAATPTPVKKPTKAQEKAAREADEINKLLADVKKLDLMEQAERATQIQSVWNIAEGYWNKGGNYSRATVQDKFALLAVMKKPEYGGIPDLMGLYDPRLDRETVTRILDTRKAIKDAEAATTTPPSIREIKKRKSKDAANVNILDAIRSYGGLNIAKITDYAKDKKVGSMFGVFQKQAYSKGWDISDMAIRLADDNYPIDMNDPADPGGAIQTQALLDRALAGEQIYPTTHDYTADTAKIDAAELAHIEALKADEAAFTVEQFNPETWKARMQEAIATKDSEAVDTLFGELPDEIANTPHDADGETYAEYILRAQNNIEADAVNDARATAIATAKTQADTAVTDAETRAEAVTTRTLMLESWTEIFGAEQAQTYMEMSDAIAQWYERTTGNSADEFYSRYYEEARKSVEADVIGDLEQSYRVGENVQNRTLTTQDAQNYARMLSRSESDARSAIRNEVNKADRIAILKALYEINPDMAESVARGEVDMLRQAEGLSAKGAVVFGADGIKATIHAFEAADFSTLVHENAHVFRRVMKDVAERTGNKQVVKDLATIEEWAGVKDGNWTVPAEEKFARGFENYIATGEAPTPRLKKAFETFKGWMMQVYRTITGSAIDVKITDEVKGVFDRMLGAETEIQRTEGGSAALFQRNKSQVSAAQYDMFAPQAEATTDTGTTGGLLPGMQESTGMMFDAQPGTGSLAKMDAGNARTIYDIDPTKTAGEFRAGDIVQDADGKQHTVSGANMRSKIVTDKGRILDPQDVTRVAKQKTLFQQTDPFKEADLPIGSIEEAGQQPPHHEAMHEGYNDYLRPLMEAMQRIAREQVQNKPLDGAMRDLSPEGAAMLKKYRNQVNADMASTKNAATKWGEQSRDFAMLNYNKRYGIDRYVDTIYPYSFFYTRSLATWAARALDKPAIFSQYARIKKQQDRYERDIPERLRGKIKISLPWLPDWMGDALYIDPMRTLFTPLNYARPFERMIQDNSYQQIEAERILQEWASDGTVAERDIVDAIKNREGATWERAFAEAQIRRESEITNPMDFMNTMLGPAWYLTTPYKLLKGEQAGIGSTPILNTTRALDTVTQGTWAQPIGDLIGMIGKPEEMLRQKLNIPEFGEYGDYYVDRQLANMVADGLISSDEAQIAMIERTGATFDTARERVKMELAMRIPTASALLSGLTADNFVQGIGRLAMTAPVSLFGAGILPSGELEYRGLKSEWNEAWKRKDAGDDKAITAFFDDHPEYEAYLSKGKEPEERLRGYLVGQIWDGYMGLGTTDRKQATAEMGDEFQRDFLSTETRSYEGIDIEQLAAWAQMLNRNVPNTASTAPSIAAPKPQIDYYSPEITRITDKFFNDRAQMFPDYYVKQNGYYNIPESDKSGRYKYLAQNPELKQYWDWKKAYEKKYPELVPIIKGQVFKRIDTSAWPPALLDYVTLYAYTGERLPKGAYKALEQVWLSEGKPLGSVDAWLASDVAPALLYSGGGQ